MQPNKMDQICPRASKKKKITSNWLPEWCFETVMPAFSETGSLVRWNCWNTTQCLLFLSYHLKICIHRLFLIAIKKKLKKIPPKSRRSTRTAVLLLRVPRFFEGKNRNFFFKWLIIPSLAPCRKWDPLTMPALPPLEAAGNWLVIIYLTALPFAATAFRLPSACIQRGIQWDTESFGTQQDEME